MNFYPKRRRTPQVVIVSLIDIFAILLIFVLVSSNFRKAQPAVTIRLPDSKSSTVAQPKREPIVLTISKTRSSSSMISPSSSNVSRRGSPSWSSGNPISPSP
jgi:biopolymer transport protein ExbD